MTGTILCGVTATDDGRAAAQLASALAARLGLRLVLAHVVDAAPGARQSPRAREDVAAAGKALAELVEELGAPAETRVVAGARAEGLARVAVEEGVDLIVLGSRTGGLSRRRLRCTLARELEAATPAPVLVAPPQTRRRAAQRLAVVDERPAR